MTETLAARFGLLSCARSTTTSDEDAKADIRATAGIAAAGRRNPHRRRRDPRTAALGRRGDRRARSAVARGSPSSTTAPTSRASSSPPDGWLRTGDVAAISPLGYVRLVDRTKDLVKSGGEWISTVELENEIMAHPKVAEAAVIAVPHPKWMERPLACVVVKPGEQLTKDEVLDFLREQVHLVAGARRRRVHRRGAQDQRRQVLQEDATRPVRRLRASHGLAGPSTAGGMPRRDGSRCRARPGRTLRRARGRDYLALGPSHSGSMDPGDRPAALF